MHTMLRPTFLIEWSRLCACLVNIHFKKVYACTFLPPYISEAGILFLPYLVRQFRTPFLLFGLYFKLNISTDIKIVHMTLVLKRRSVAENMEVDNHKSCTTDSIAHSPQLTPFTSSAHKLLPKIHFNIVFPVIPCHSDSFARAFLHRCP
jgi:hypothetical protein